jgi:hypothetical protein
MPGEPHPDRARLQKEWEVAIGLPPPPFLSVRIMENALAHEAQCKAKGGLPAPMRRALARVADGESSAPIPATSATLRPGAHLVREWNGRTYQVEVLDKGFRMDGRTWPSLSALARHITGTQWSGPRFFGLANRRERSA